MDNFVLTHHAVERFAQRCGWGTYNLFGLKRKIIKGINNNVFKCTNNTWNGQKYYHVPSLDLRLIVKHDYKIHKNVIVTIVENNDNYCFCCISENDMLSYA